MTRLSYARVLIEIDLFAELPSLIDITLPNGVSKAQVVVYESCPDFASSAKHWDTPLQYATQLPVISEKSIPQLLLLPLDALTPQLTLKLLHNSHPGRNLMVNHRLTQWQLRRL
jgi:hypothetical protein